jgi:hypothetical protein
MNVRAVNNQIIATIPDRKGREFDYRLEVEPGTPWRCYLTKLVPNEEGKVTDDETHTVTVWPSGYATCTCRAFEFRQRNNRTDCKHCVAALELRNLLALPELVKART